MIDPPDLTGAADAVVPGDGLLLDDGDAELLHAAAVETASTAAPARQAVRIDLSRKLTAFTYS